MKNYKLVAENPDHFVIHDTKDKSQFKVAKAHIDLPMMKKLAGIQHFDEGGDVLDPYANATTGTEPVPQKTMTDVSPFTLPKIDDPTVSQSIDPNAQAYQPTNNITTQSGPLSFQPAGIPGQSIDPNAPPPQLVAQADQIPTSPPVTMPATSDNQAKPAGSPTQNIEADYGNALSKSFAQEQAANQAAADAIGIQSQQQAKSQDQLAASMQQAQNVYQSHLNDLTQGAQALTNDIANTHVDPQHFWNNSSTGSKIGMLAGMIISGFGAGAGQGNMAMNIVNKNIEQDIDAQKAELGKKQNLLSHNLAETGNLNAAIDQTRLGLLAVTQGQMQAAALKQGGPLAQANMEKQNAAIDQQKAGIIHDLAVKKMGYDLLSQPNASNNVAPGSIDQNRLLGLRYTGMIDPKDESAIQSESKDYGMMANKVSWLYNQTQDLKDLYKNPVANHFLINEKKDLISTEMAKDNIGRVSELSRDAFRNNLESLVNNPSTADQKTNDLVQTYTKQFTFPTIGNKYKLINPNDPALLSPAKERANLQTKFRSRPTQSSPVQQSGQALGMK